MESLREKIPFNCIITGPTNCGKTRYLIQMLRQYFRYAFSYIVLICPTYKDNKTYRNFARGDRRFIVLSPSASNSEEIDSLLQDLVTYFSGTNTLFILDDCAVSKDLKRRSNQFIDLAFSGIHKGISVQILTQKLTSIAKPFRDNVALVVAFHSPSGVSTKTLFGGGLSEETRKEYLKLLKEGKYSTIVLLLRYPYNVYLEIPTHIQYMSELEQLLDEKSVALEGVDEGEVALAILATLGNTKEYLGKYMTLADVHRLSKKDMPGNIIRCIKW